MLKYCDPSQHFKMELSLIKKDPARFAWFDSEKDILSSFYCLSYTFQFTQPFFPLKLLFMTVLIILILQVYSEASRAGYPNPPPASNPQSPVSAYETNNSVS